MGFDLRLSQGFAKGLADDALDIAGIVGIERRHRVGFRIGATQPFFGAAIF